MRETETTVTIVLVSIFVTVFITMLLTKYILLRGSNHCDEVRKCVKDIMPKQLVPIAPPGTAAGSKATSEPFSQFDPVFIAGSGGGLDGTVPYSEYLIGENVEPELIAGHKEYMQDAISNVQSAAKFSIRDDRNDLNKTVGFRRPIYMTPISGNALQVPGDDNVDREVENITMVF